MAVVDLTTFLHLVDANANQQAKMEDLIDRLDAGGMDPDDYITDDVNVYYEDAGNRADGGPAWGKWYDSAHGSHVARCIHIAPGIGTTDIQQKYTFGHEIGHVIAEDRFDASDRSALRALMPVDTGGWQLGQYHLKPSENWAHSFIVIYSDIDNVNENFYDNQIPPANFSAAQAILEATTTGDGGDPGDPIEEWGTPILIGQNGKPGADFTEHWSNTYNQSAEPLTMPEKGRIVSLGQWIAAVGSDTQIRLCVWSRSGNQATGNNLLAQSALKTITARTWAAGNVDLYEADLATPLELNAGQQIWVGFSRDIDGHHQLTGRNSGTHIDRRRATWPDSMDGYDGGDHGFGNYAIGAFAYYTQPAGMRVRRSGVWVQADAVRVRRSGVWVDATAVKVRRSGQWVDAD